MLYALASIAHYMQPINRRLIMKAFINSPFGYCPLVWMFHSRKLNSRINRIHERTQRIVFNGNISTCGELLSKDKSVSIHVRNIQALAIELFKVVTGLYPVIMKHISTQRNLAIFVNKHL